MEVHFLFKLIKSLTGQTTLSSLTMAYKAILSEHFENTSFSVFELQPTRLGNEKNSSIICVDCEFDEESFLLSDSMSFDQAVNQCEPVIADEHGRELFIFPVVLYDNSVSHIIVIRHCYADQTQRDLLLGLQEIVTDIFRSIHEKGYDPLTRILNRQAFDQTASELAYSQHGKNLIKSLSAIAMLDIDKFKEINDRFGHAIGDEILLLFAQTIRSVLRREDLFFRYGGEEFVIFVKDVEQEQAQQVLERCRLAIEERRFPQVGQVTVSIGFTDLDSHFHPVDNLSKADKALYFIKKNGRNKVLSYEHLVNSGQLEPITPKEGSADFWD